MATPDSYWGRTALYRLFDADGGLLYIGISNDPEFRWSQHAKTKEWWSLVERKAVQWYPRRVEAARAESEAIHVEKPRFNVIHARAELPPPRSAGGVRVDHLLAVELRRNLGRITNATKFARFELGELPIAYVMNRKDRAAAIVPTWLAEWAEQHADEVIASLRAERES